eukprot:gene25725-biopygen22192
MQFEQELYRVVVDGGQRIGRSGDRTQQYGIGTCSQCQFAARVVLVEEPAAHAVADTLAELAEIHDSTVGHVLAGEVSDTFYDSTGAGVTNCEAIACFTFDEHSSTGGAEECEVADQHVSTGVTGAAAWAAHGNHAAAHALSYAVVTCPGVFQVHAVVAECAERQARRSGRQDAHAARRQIPSPALVGQYSRSEKPGRSVVEFTFEVDRQLTTDALVPVTQVQCTFGEFRSGHGDRGLATVEEHRTNLVHDLLVERVLTFEVHRIVDGDVRGGLEHRVQLQIADNRRVIEQMQEIRSTPRFLKGPHSQIREQFPSFVSDVEKVLRHRAGIAVEQFRVGGQTGGALDVAVLGHDAAHHHQRRRTELEAVCAE